MQISEPLSQKMPVLPRMLILISLVMLQHLSLNFLADFLEESPLTSLPLPNVRFKFFELTFHAAPHIGRQL